MTFEQPQNGAQKHPNLEKTLLFTKDDDKLIAGFSLKNFQNGNFLKVGSDIAIFGTVW